MRWALSTTTPWRAMSRSMLEVLLVVLLLLLLMMPPAVEAGRALGMVMVLVLVLLLLVLGGLWGFFLSSPGFLLARPAEGRGSCGSWW